MKPVDFSNRAISPRDHPGTVSMRAHQGAAVVGYEILSELGRGRTGVVYKARQISLDRLVALKTIQEPSLCQQEGLSRFISEARTIARLQHPNIVQLYEISVQHDLPLFAMELVDGGNLATHLAGRPQPFSYAGQLVQSLAQAVQAAHEQGIIHRDLKPTNVLMTAMGIPKISDFGLAAISRVETSRPGSGDYPAISNASSASTANYMAPELARGPSRDVGPACDIYSLGAILYEMLTGRPPHNAESPAETVFHVVQNEPIAPSRLRARLPADLETICLKCLEKEPTRRYSNAQELADDLGRYLAGTVIYARRAPVIQQAWKWLRRRPGTMVLSGTAVAMLVVFLGLILWYQVDLEGRVTQSREQEQQARDAQEEAERTERLTRKRALVNEWLQEALNALNREDYLTATVSLARARDHFKDETDPDLRSRCDILARQINEGQQAHKQLMQFRQARDRTLFELTAIASSDTADALQRTRTAGQKALAIYDVLGQARDNRITPPALRAQEREEVITGCFELLLVVANATVDNPTEALRLLDRAERLGVPTQTWHQRRARYARQMGDLIAARFHEQRARTQPPGGILDLLLQGQDHLHAGDLIKASAAFERLLQDRSGHFWAQCFLALTWHKRQRHDLAVVGLAACIGQRPDLPWLYYLRGAARVGMGDHDAAEADFARALQQPLDDAVRYALFSHRGISRVRQGRIKSAISDLHAALALRPRLSQSYVQLSQAYLADGKVDEALSALDSAITCDAGLASLYRTRARVRLFRQQVTLALADLEKAIQLDPKAPAELRAADQLERARLFSIRKDHEQVVLACNRAIASKADGTGYRLKAEALVALGRYREALTALNAYLAQQPMDVDALCGRASVRTRLGHYQGAQADYTRALEIRPDAEVLVARGWTYLLTETPKPAIVDFDQALRRFREPLSPRTVANAHVGRGLARASLGHVVGAIEDARKALRSAAPTAELIYNAARIYAQASWHTDSRASVGARDEYARRAVDLLTDAIMRLPESERGTFWRTQVRNDWTIRPLRSTPAFQRLETRYQQMTIND